jgi:hypothetical protein
LFSTTNLALPPNRCSTNGNSLRAMTSVAPPGAKPMTTSIGLSSGHPAQAGAHAANPTAAATSAMTLLFMEFHPFLVVCTSLVTARLGEEQPAQHDA